MNPITTKIALGSFLLSGALAQSAIVFSELDLVNNTITLTNTGSSAVDIGGWRFCSHDLEDIKRYSSSTFFADGVSIIGLGSLVVDATSVILAGPLAANTMSIGLYNDLDGALSFGSPDDLSAFIQFTPEGNTDFGNAEERTGTAVTADLWDAEGSFVEVGAADTFIRLDDLNSSTGASSFSAVPEPGSTVLIGLAAALTCMRRKRCR
ncbi:PEP-CTERM sorting domain-containing protein [bacterium]|nr:PEP-CTERM sorting domain-containing protein [bacterium]